MIGTQHASAVLVVAAERAYRIAAAHPQGGGPPQPRAGDMSDDDRIEKLEREVQDLQDRLDNVTEERDELRAANETLTDKVSAAREEIEETLRGLDR